MPPGDNDPAAPQRRKELTPILDQICNGGSSVVLNLVRLSAVAGDRLLFKCPPLNKVAIFKYPNFESEIALPAAVLAPAKVRANKTAPPERPIETAIYVPHDHADFERGGYAIYLRHPDFEELLKRHIGLDVKATSSAYEADMRILNAIDRIPSLDPFLLKDALSFCAASVDPAYFQIAPDEERAVREVIAEKLRPIVARAFSVTDVAQVADRTERFLDALWNPEMPEGEMFLRSLGIVRDDPRSIIEGWKGIAYYKFTFERSRGAVVALLKWLESKDSRPSGGRRSRHDAEQIDMFRRAIGEKLRVVSGNMGSVFRRYDGSHSELMEDGNPEGFRRFLENVHSYYWVLGYCSMALRHAANIFERFVGDPPRKLDFDRTQEMFARLSGTLSSQSGGTI